MDLLCTDPLYSQESLPLWSDLAVLAARVLKPHGMLLAYTGSMYLPEVMHRLGEAIDYWWCGSLLLPGEPERCFARKVWQRTKVVLFYVPRGGAGPGEWFRDSYWSEGPEKAHHPYEQGVGPLQYWIGCLTSPGEMVLDPFLGSGTTGVAAVGLGRHFIGIEVDPAAFATAEERIAEVAGQQRPGASTCPNETG